MSDVINPRNSAEAAAQQVILELIKAGNLGAVGNGKAITDVYENLVKEYKRLNKESQ
ncbi:hypothetical protein RBQ08_RS03210 [Enterobacter hormaechei]|uniref:hypothetical protein n=1 Tax=Enterobacter TaxID=547 RepID=UPI000797B389|nr:MULTISPECIES: hypothetical protein [Enterobacter]HAV1836366.1 hypothetical protein [Enterobacter hormaechei subsp. steigerwaltii]ELC6509889.1 hypothetical protein [Enterobacter hormaechei]MBE4892105.1 hypothetical protein [Enterobacter cloacae complex sp. P16RS2]MCE1929011.1 hypothetical protein [Enterobacter hormaechei]MCK6732284.1 hypothetical protein [Enterobacter bugandensis]